jgi:tRNA (cmo5U34)-methyltransferase
VPRDTLYKLPRERVGEFTFDQSVVDVFPDMIARSVPGYASVLSLIEQLTARFAQPATHLYDLGCSLGSACHLIRLHAPKDCVLHAVDNSPAMIERLTASLDADLSHDGCPVQIHLADVMDMPLSQASFVVLNWTLQFIAPAQRLELLQRIFDGMTTGGALLMSEVDSGNLGRSLPTLRKRRLPAGRALVSVL